MNVYIDGNFFIQYESCDYRALLLELMMNLDGNGTILIVDISKFPNSVVFIDVNTMIEVYYSNNQVSLSKLLIRNNIFKNATKIDFDLKNQLPLLESAISDNSGENILKVVDTLSRELRKI